MHAFSLPFHLVFVHFLKRVFLLHVLTAFENTEAENIPDVHVFRLGRTAQDIYAPSTYTQRVGG